MDTWIQTVSGGRFDPINPRPEDVKIADIAHALSNICRFNGHCSEFYSVAQHSVLVCDALPQEFKPWGLLHDASEAYIADVSMPVKRSPEFGAYGVIEWRIMLAVCERFGLPWSEPAAVKAADNLVLATEARDLMPRREVAEWAWLPKPMPERIIPWTPAFARTEFLVRFHALFF
jgi:hypothetical protein